MLAPCAGGQWFGHPGHIRPSLARSVSSWFLTRNHARRPAAFEQYIDIHWRQFVGTARSRRDSEWRFQDVALCNSIRLYHSDLSSARKLQVRGKLFGADNMKVRSLLECQSRMMVKEFRDPVSEKGIDCTDEKMVERLFLEEQQALHAELQAEKEANARPVLRMCTCVFDHVDCRVSCQERLSSELKKDREQRQEEKAGKPRLEAAKHLQDLRRSDRSTFRQSSRRGRVRLLSFCFTAVCTSAIPCSCCSFCILVRASVAKAFSLSLCLSVCLSVCLSACLAGWLAGWLSICLSVSLCLSLSLPLDFNRPQAKSIESWVQAEQKQRSQASGAQPSLGLKMLRASGGPAWEGCSACCLGRDGCRLSV